MSRRPRWKHRRSLGDRALDRPVSLMSVVKQMERIYHAAKAGECVVARMDKLGKDLKLLPKRDLDFLLEEVSMEMEARGMEKELKQILQRKRNRPH